MNETLKNLRNKTILLALCYIVAGLFFMFAPNATLKTITILLALLALVVGIILTISYLKKNSEADASLTGGLLLIIIAAFMLIKPEVIWSIIYVVFGFAILINGCLKLETGINLRRSENKNAIIILIAAVITLILGLIVLFAPFGATALIILVGVSMLLAGIFDIIASQFMLKENKKSEQPIDIN